MISILNHILLLVSGLVKADEKGWSDNTKLNSLIYYLVLNSAMLLVFGILWQLSLRLLKDVSIFIFGLDLG